MNILFKELEDKKKRIAVIGLGYVGLPLLVSLAKKFSVIGYDKNEKKVSNLKKGIDTNDEVDSRELADIECPLTSDPRTLKGANFFIISVPTPIDLHKSPDLSYVKEASQTVAGNMPADSIIVYESTVYPGVTEEVCIPIIEEFSGMKNKKDFLVGYSPERINPGDKVHTLENIVKIVSAQDRYSLDIISSVYGKIISAGIYRAKSIKVAEAAKVIENTQRDINVALINELSVIFSKLGIDTSEVLEAAGTKWNFLKFYPGLVGGHCIGVDPYYLTYKARETGYYPKIINSGRIINDSMGEFIGERTLRFLLAKKEKNRGNLRVVLFGISFKEDVRDFRNSKVKDIYDYFRKYDLEVKVCDPVVDKKEVKKVLGIDCIDYKDIKDAEAAIFCVAHSCFKDIDLGMLREKMNAIQPLLFDIKWIFKSRDAVKAGFEYWRL